MIEKYRLLQQSGLTVFDRKAVANIFGVTYASTNPLLFRLVKKGILRRLRRGSYVLSEPSEVNFWKIANEIVKPSAVSLWTILSEEGLTTQVPRTLQSVTPKRSTTVAPKDFSTFQYFHLPSSLYIDVHPDVHGIFRVSPEKALLDILYVQEKVDWDSLYPERFDRTRLRSLAQLFPLRIQDALTHSPFEQ